tara:strand:+ start:646 stop:1734 length:1089 start_codon:yes stop_codon:yes gene_type:complete
MNKKSLSAKKIIHRNFNFKKILKDKKIFEIYKSFEINLKNLKNLDKIAVSVSGGPDSLALCFLIACYKFKQNKKIQSSFILIDHGLRKNSQKEAITVKKILKSKKLDLKILKWKGKKPTSNLQNLARKKRYEILFKECEKLNIKVILTGHHQDDMYETFFSRLLRGSGTEGLSSFAKIEKQFNLKNKKFKVVRPLHNLTKQDLIHVSNIAFKFYVKDPSNELDRFQRVRIRKLISNLKKEGLDFRKLNLTINNLAATNTALNEIVKNNINKNAIYLSRKKYLINSEFFIKPEEVIFRSLSQLIKKISQNEYPPRGKKMINLIRDLKTKQHIKVTLGGTIIEKIHNSVIVSKEKTKNIKFATI